MYVSRLCVYTLFYRQYFPALDVSVKLFTFCYRCYAFYLYYVEIKTRSLIHIAYIRLGSSAHKNNRDVLVALHLS